jgi:hypothetical protein
LGQGGEMNQALYAHMNNKRKMKKNKNRKYESVKKIALRMNQFLVDNKHY